MRIETFQTIASQPALMIRKLMRKGVASNWTIELVEDVLALCKRTARRIDCELEEEAYISKVERMGNQYWENTIKGNALGMATAAKPVTRAKAPQKLKEFLERVKKVNEDDNFLFKVKKIVFLAVI